MSKSNDVVVPRTHAQLTAIAQKRVDISLAIEPMFDMDDCDAKIQTYLESLDLSPVSRPITSIERGYNEFVTGLDELRTRHTSTYVFMGTYGRSFIHDLHFE